MKSALALSLLVAAVRGAHASDSEAASNAGGVGVRGAARDLQQGNGNAYGKYVAAEGKRVEGSYLVTYDDSIDFKDVPGKAKASLAKTGGKIKKNGMLGVINGFSADMTESEAKALSLEPGIKAVEEDATVQKLAVTWGLDRVDQRNLPLDNAYAPSYGDGTGTTIFILDTGINYAHEEFGGRASFGYDAYPLDGQNGNDCDGHGTHCAGTAAGTVYGVAPGANLVSVRVLGCDGSGTYAGVIEGINYVAGRCGGSTERCVASMSLGGGKSSSVNAAVANLRSVGVPVAVAAGNSNTDASRSSPASEPSAITVGSTDSDDRRSSFSNYGDVLDIFAPGRSITSAWVGSASTYNTISGTSMATPHVAGALALIMGQNPTAPTANDVEAELIRAATTGLISNPGRRTKNRLLYVGDSTTTNPTNPPPEEPASCSGYTDETECNNADGCRWRGRSCKSG